ncbi:precorrin-3B synthase [Corynebacterium vitaeruminis]|uniref:Nitrite/Sulfite reductase ferredoxin-like domain-containing protein n=1 Tax=Corynebacterium vitaeruminis DSM 20294 TaxID=1224164 RepID=W5Y8F1_9CORY|nr:precorrin-3B synthase [Corynebacterium vitaeruminis]AHI22778.1 hypothetical protein B843_06965 [Corynebacterium vitaeruminis DSM 20294]
MSDSLFSTPIVDFSRDAAVLIEHPDRSRQDMCPGTLRLHKAEDGLIGRVRFPGGLVRPEQWNDIARLSTELGNGTVHVTTRGNMQFRGVEDSAAFAEFVEKAGFLPSREHDKLRNIIASPRATHLWGLIDDLDHSLLSSTDVIGLSGRTLFGFDAGQGDILSQHPDFGVFEEDGGFRLILGGALTDYVVTDRGLVGGALTRAAAAWQSLRGDNWRVHEAPATHAAILAAVAEAVDLASSPAPDVQRPEDARPIGWIEDDNGSVALGAGLKFGFFSAKVASILGAVGAPVTITPWASLLIHGLDSGDADAVVKVLAPQGLIFDANSPWLRVTACTGLPGCAKSLSHTQEDATQLVLGGNVPDGLVHFSGCDRRCGHPLAHHTEYVATGDGEYEVNAR